MSDESIRRWVAGRRRAAAREQREVTGAAPAPPASIARGLAMIALAGRLHGWPLPQDPADERADRAAYARWARLRRRLGVP